MCVCVGVYPARLKLLPEIDSVTFLGYYRLQRGLNMNVPLFLSCFFLVVQMDESNRSEKVSGKISTGQQLDPGLACVDVPGAVW